MYWIINKNRHIKPAGTLLAEETSLENIILMISFTTIKIVVFDVLLFVNDSLSLCNFNIICTSSMVAWALIIQFLFINNRNKYN